MQERTRFRVPPDTERAWAAGFFDGEGHARAQSHRGVRVELTVVQKETTTLERFAAAVGGVGRIKGRKLNGTGPYREHVLYDWRIASHDATQHVIDMLWPYLSEPKRAQIRAACAVRDAFRAGIPDGFKGRHQKLSVTDVAEIRTMLASGMVQADIARQYNVSDKLISMIKHGKRRL